MIYETNQLRSEELLSNNNREFGFVYSLLKQRASLRKKGMEDSKCPHVLPTYPVFKRGKSSKVAQAIGRIFQIVLATKSKNLSSRNFCMKTRIFYNFFTDGEQLKTIYIDFQPNMKVQTVKQHILHKRPFF